MSRIHLKTIVSLIISLSALNSSAAYDLSLLSLYRNKPVAGGVEVEAGKGLLIWGDHKDVPWYGYWTGIWKA
ncbi:MAG: hypothetical protein ACPGJV_10230 [Bacteriovoracaceae bacterium]